MERLFVNNSHKGVEFIQLLNGSSWTLSALCNDIASKYKIKNYQAEIIVVWIDLEKQSCGSIGASEAITNALIEAGADAAKICVCVPNRMSENAILADEELIQKYFDEPDYKYTSEGENGKHLLKEKFTKQGVTYKETKHGVELLRKMRIERAAQCSPSVAAFHSKISAISNCWWF